MILIIPILLIALSVFMLNYFDQWRDEGWYVFGSFMLAVSGTILIIMIIAIFIQQMETMSMQEQRDAIQQSYNHARSHGDLETATIAKDIADFNRNLVEYKYWNDSIWYDVFYHDSIEDVELIK